MIWLIISKFRKMIQDLTISYVCSGIETTLTIKDEHYDNMPYNLADMFEKVIRESDANPQIVIENLKSAFENDYDIKIVTENDEEKIIHNELPNIALL